MIICCATSSGQTKCNACNLYANGTHAEGLNYLVTILTCCSFFTNSIDSGKAAVSLLLRCVTLCNQRVLRLLQAGSLIVEHLRTYRQPVIVYLPPGAELRGGAWVVVDAQINPAQVHSASSAHDFARSSMILLKTLFWLQYLLAV